MDVTQYLSTDLSNITQIQTFVFEQFHVWMKSQLNNNQFLVAGVFTVLLSSLLYVLRNIPALIWNFLTYRFAIRVNIFNNNPHFYEIANELNKKTIHLFSRHKMLDASKLTIGMGGSLSWFYGRLVRVTREKEKSDSREFKQTLNLTFPFITNRGLQKLFERFLNDMKSDKAEKISVYTTDERYLQFMKDTPKRPKESIFLPEETLNYIEKRIDFFLENRKWYRTRGIPYKYAILLHGVPGTGKTTLAKYLASYTDRNLVLIQPSKLSKVSGYIANQDFDEDFNSHDMTMNENNSKNKKYIGLMEDIDCDEITAKRKIKKNIKIKDINIDEDVSNSNQKKSIFVNLSDLLNSIDGLNAPEDFILVATTNHIGDLDPALLRKGRFDDIIEILPMETPEIKRMISVFREIPIETLDGEDFLPIPGSILQDLILQYLDKPLEEFLTALKNRKP